MWIKSSIIVRTGDPLRTTHKKSQPAKIINFSDLRSLGISEKAAQFYREGRSLRQISKLLKIPKSTLREHFIQSGISLRPSTRTPEGKALRKSQPIGGFAPYGYDFLDGQLVIHPKEVHVVRRIQNLRKEGHSFSSIARNLNDLGIKPRRANKWTAWGISLIAKGLCRQQLKNLKGAEDDRSISLLFLYKLAPSPTGTVTPCHWLYPPHTIEPVLFHLDY